MNDSELDCLGLWSQKLTQKLELRLNLEMIDVCSCFGINCNRAYGDSISAQLFINYASNTVP